MFNKRSSKLKSQKYRPLLRWLLGRWNLVNTSCMYYRQLCHTELQQDSRITFRHRHTGNITWFIVKRRVGTCWTFLGCSIGSFVSKTGLRWQIENVLTLSGCSSVINLSSNSAVSGHSWLQIEQIRLVGMHLVRF